MPQITKFERRVRHNIEGEVSAPLPVNVSGLYEYPSFKLIYALPGWSQREYPLIGGSDMRFLLRDVWNTPVGEQIEPPHGSAAAWQWPSGLALYDEGRLVRYFPPEELYKRYRSAECMPFSTYGPDRYTRDCVFDEIRAAWNIQTRPRGPALLQGSPRWYSESWVLDARTGKVLHFSTVDWFTRAGIAGASVLGVALTIIVIRRRKRSSAAGTVADSG